MAGWLVVAVAVTLLPASGAPVAAQESAAGQPLSDGDTGSSPEVVSEPLDPAAMEGQSPAEGWTPFSHWVSDEAGVMTAARVADDALVVRGGQNLPQNISGGSGVTVDAAGRAHGVSVQAGTESLETLVRGHIPHGQIGVTTAGEIRAAGGTIIRDPLPGNPFDCLVGCITPEALSNLLRPTIKNPFR